MMKYAISVLTALFVSSVLAGLTIAQESGEEELVPKPKWTREQIENPPVRDLKVDLLRDPYPIPFRESNRAGGESEGPGIEERKFMAVVQFAVSPSNNSQRTDWSSFLDRASKLPMGKFSGGYVLLPNLGVRPMPEPNRTQLKYLLTQVPDGALDKETIAYFESANVDRGLFHFINRRDAADRTIRQEFRIFARSAEECERCVKGLLTLLDHGFSRPLQLKLLQKREEIAVEVKANKIKLDEAEAEIMRVNKQLAEYKEFTVEMLPTLRQQQMALDVDLAGTLARIKACEKLLENNRPALSNERRASVEDTKIQAEINLAGFQAKRLTLLGFMDQVKELSALSDRQEELTATIKKARLVVGSGPPRCLEIDADIEFLAPVKVIDNRFTIQPIEWTKP